MDGRQMVPRWGFNAATVALLGLALLALAAIGAAPKAGAAFTTGKCAGSNIDGRGASFARDAHTLFNFNLKNNFCIGTPGQSTLNVNYQAQGSGAGRTSVKVRNDTPRFGMTDEPPTATEIQQMDKGTGSAAPETDTNPNDNGNIHVIPAAVGAVAPLVNFPNNCDYNLLPASAKTDEQDLNADSVPDGTVRVRFNKTQFEAVWAQGASGVPNVDWDDVFTELSTDTDCQVPIIRVVRFDESGTTFAFKDYLGAINGGRGWRTTYRSGPNLTREWPGATFGPRTDCNPTTPPNGPGTAVDATDHLTSACSNGNGPLVDKLIATDGSIGYSDVSTARSASQSLAVTPRANAGSPYDNDTYWTQVQNGSGAFTEPTADSNGFRTDGNRGSNCATTTFGGVPSTTLDADWTAVSGVNAPSGFGICTLTYGLVFDDNAKVWGATAAEEAKARTVKDYWENIVSDGAQAVLFTRDYSPLPTSLLTLARAGVASVDWNKTGGGGGGGGGGGTVIPPVIDPPIVVPPSNQFSVTRTKISRAKKNATVSVKLPGAGQLVLLATTKSKGKTVKVARVTLNANKAGTFNLVIKPTGKAKNLLVEDGTQKVALKLTFTPSGTGGVPKTTNRSVTLKAQPQN